MKKPILTTDLLVMLPEITEDSLRNAIRRGHLHPERLSNGLFVWPPRAVEEAKQHFAARPRRQLQPEEDENRSQR